MAAPDQMTREELFKAKERVELQLERLKYHQIGRWGGDVDNPTKDGLESELLQILEEINAELAEGETKNA